MYWQTTLIAICLMLIYVLLSWIINRRFRWVSTFNLVLISVLVALSIVLTNVVGYSKIFFGKQIELGNFLILVIGMMFGPWAGLSAAIASDLLGTLVFLGGTFHIGFMVTKIGFAIAGSLVFNSFLIDWWKLKLLVLMALAIMVQLFVIHPLALYGTMVQDWQTLWARFLIALPGKGITLAIEIMIYPFLSFLAFRLLYVLYNRRNKAIILWASRFGEISFSWPKMKWKLTKKYNFKKDNSALEKGNYDENVS